MRLTERKPSRIGTDAATPDRPSEPRRCPHFYGEWHCIATLADDENLCGVHEARRERLEKEAAA